LGAGITLDKPLARSYPIDAVVRDAAVTTAGYQGKPAPNQWFGGPELTTSAPQFGRTITVRKGSMVLRDASGLVVDSVNYGGLVDPWAAAGYQAASGMGQGGCYVPAPGEGRGFGQSSTAGAPNSSAGRFPDGVDTGSNCNDFRIQAASILPMDAAAGATNIKVFSVAGFVQGETIMIDTGANQETAVIATVGTPGATKVHTATGIGTKAIPVASVTGFSAGQTISIDTGANTETAVISSIVRFPAASFMLNAPLSHLHAVDAQVSGTGITLAAPLRRGHAGGAQVTDDIPTPGAPNRYHGIQ